MGSLFLTTHIGYATKGDSDEPSSSGYLITRVPLAVRWDAVVAIGAIEDPALCYDNESVTEPIPRYTRSTVASILRIATPRPCVSGRNGRQVFNPLDYR